MAQELKLRRNSVNTSLINTSGFHILDPGWIPKVADYTEGRPLPVNEALTIESCYGTQDTLAAGEIILNKLGRDAARYIQDRTEQHPVWLHDKLDNETGERRALVRKMKLERLTEQHGSGEMIAAKPIYRLGIEREGLWERTATRTFPTTTPGAAASIIYDYTATADVVGDAPARIASLAISSAAAGYTLGRFWIGIRSANKHGTLANFANVWECENGTNEAIAADAGDATASGGNKVIGTPTGSNVWEKYFTLKLENISANEQDNYGLFLWLLRHQVSAGTFQVRLRWGYAGMDDSDHILGPIKKVDSASWNFIEMDQAPIPLRDTQIFPLSELHEGYDAKFQIQVWAKRTSGAGTIDFDCLCPVPLDEGWLTASGFGISMLVNAYDSLYIGESPKRTIQNLVYDFSADSFSHIGASELGNFRLPVGDGRMIIVYARATSSVLTDTIKLNHALPVPGKYYECWYTLRGTE